MKTITANKGTLVKLNNVDAGIVAFQMVEFVINFFGNEIISMQDTKIMEDGRQLVINGDGYIPAGYEVA